MQAHPKGVSEADVQALVKRQDLPEWVGNVLSTNCKSSHASAAVAPTPADAGEAVTSRERPLLAETSDAAVEMGGVHVGASMTISCDRGKVCLRVVLSQCMKSILALAFVDSMRNFNLVVDVPVSGSAPNPLVL